MNSLDLWVPYQPNPNHCKDCGIRALMCATGKGWFEVFDDVVNVARKHQLMPSSAQVIGIVAVRYGFTKFYSISEQITVEQFARQHSTGTYLVANKEHILCIKDGHYYDESDSRGLDVICCAKLK